MVWVEEKHQWHIYGKHLHVLDWQYGNTINNIGAENRTYYTLKFGLNIYQNGTVRNGGARSSYIVYVLCLLPNVGKLGMHSELLL